MLTTIKNCPLYQTEPIPGIARDCPDPLQMKEEVSTCRKNNELLIFLTITSYHGFPYKKRQQRDIKAT